MNQKQIQKINMVDATLVVVNQNKPLWQANATFTSAVNAVQTDVGVLNVADTVRLAVTMPLTETKGQAKVVLLAATMAHAAAGIGYAVSINSIPLKATCSVTESDLIRMADADLGNACMIVYNAVQPFIGSMAAWGVTTVTLTALQGDIATFNALVSTPVGQIGIKKAAGMTIDTQLEVIDGILADTLDTLMLQFKATQAAFYNAYFSARKIHHTGVHHSVIFEGFIYDATGGLIPYAEVTLRVDNKMLRKHFTDASGKYKFTRLTPNTYVMQISAPGFVTQSKTFVITVLQVVDADFTMLS
jgi:hypothetical protein